MKTKYIAPTIAAFGLLLLSCGKKTADTGPSKDNLKPNQAVETWVTDMRDGGVASLWDAMPASYQKDVEGIAHGFGNKVDSEIYNEVMKTLGSASGLLKTKKDMILQLADKNSAAIGAEKTSKVKTNYDAFVNLIDAIMKSRIKDAEGMKNLVIADFLSEIQPQCKEVAAVVVALASEEGESAWMKNPQSKIISETGDTAEVSDPAADGKTIKLKRISNRWVPEEMATEWAAKMEEAKSAIAKMESMDEVEKQQMLGILRTAQAVIKDLETAESPEQLEQKMSEAAQKIMGGS